MFFLGMVWLRPLMSCVIRKSVFKVSNQVRHKPGCSATEDGQWLEISDLENRGIHCSTICVTKTKMLISCAVTAQLICAFVFTYAKIRLSYDGACFCFSESQRENQQQMHHPPQFYPGILAEEVNAVRKVS